MDFETIGKTISDIHFPIDESYCIKARNRLAFTEFYNFFVELNQIKKAYNRLKSDYVFIESTYGGENKNINKTDYIKFQKDVATELKNGNIVWIPALSLNRTQKVLYEIKKG